MDSGESLIPSVQDTTTHRHMQLTLEAISLHAPVLYLHHQEIYHPCSAPWFLERCELRLQQGGPDNSGPWVILLPSGHVTQQALIEAEHQHQQNVHELVLWLDPKYWGGPAAEDLDSQAPLYVNAKLIVDENGAAEAYEINYINFHGYNGCYQIYGMPFIQSGAHVGDWEHTTVRLDACDLSLVGVWYNAHRNLEGEWAAAKDVPRTEDGRIISYVALHGHGNYPRAGTTPRLFFAANDSTSRTGLVWRPKLLHLMSGLEKGSNCSVAISRGSCLPRPTQSGQDPQEPGQDTSGGGAMPATGSPATDKSATAAPAMATSATAFSASAVSPGNAQSQICGVALTGPLPDVLLDSGSWQRFTGHWGTSPSPAVQDWFKEAEPPVSRGWVKRIWLPLAAGTQHHPTTVSTTNDSKGLPHSGLEWLLKHFNPSSKVAAKERMQSISGRCCRGKSKQACTCSNFEKATSTADCVAEIQPVPASVQNLESAGGGATCYDDQDVASRCIQKDGMFSHEERKAQPASIIVFALSDFGAIDGVTCALCVQDPWTPSG